MWLIAFGTLLLTVEDAGLDFFQPLRVEQAFFQMSGDQGVQFLCDTVIPVRAVGRSRALVEQV